MRETLAAGCARVVDLCGSAWRSGRSWCGRLVGRPWQRVIALAVLLLAGGILVVVMTESQTWTEVGTACIGGSIVGLVFAVAQYTLDEQGRARQIAGDVRLMVTSSSVLEGIGLAGVDLSGAYLWRKHLARAHLDGARMVGADLRESDLRSATLRRADLRQADLYGARLEEAELDGADLTGARLDARFLGDARLVGAVLGQAVFAGPPAAGDADSGVSGRVDMSAARLDGARLTGVRLPALRASFVSARDVDATGAVLAASDLSCADLRNAGFSGADLRDADLSGADLTGAVLAAADLRGARLVGARLQEADLTGAHVSGADFGGTDLRGAFLTNLDLSTVDLDGAWVFAADLDRVAHPTVVPVGLVVVDQPGQPGPASPVAAASDGVDGEGASIAMAGTVVVHSPDPGLRDLTRQVVERLRARRRGLEAANGDLEGIIVHDGPLDVGHPSELGLPSHPTLRRWPGWFRPRVELRRTGDGQGVAVVVHRRGIRPVLLTVDGPGAPGEPGEPGAGEVATAVQLALAGGGLSRSVQELGMLSSWLEHRDRPLEPVLDELLALNPRNPLALLLRAGSRPYSDAAEMSRAADEARIAWAASPPGIRRALAATHLSRTQCQLVHRTSVDKGLVLARARAAGDAALGWFQGTRAPRRKRRRHLALRSKAEHVRAFAQHVTEDVDDMRDGIDRYRRAIRRLERHRLPVSTTTRNNMAYCLMTLLGRFTAGPAAGYREAMDQLRMILAYCGVVEDWQVQAERPVSWDGRGQPIDGTVGVIEMARRSATGAGPPAERRLRHRALHLAFANLGNLYRLAKRFDEALACYGAALYCKPDYVEAMGERAWVHLERADPAAAVEDMERVLATPSGTPQQKARVVVDFVDALERVGRPRDQRRWIEQARRLDPGYARVEELDARWRERFDEGDEVDGAPGVGAPA